MSPDDAAPTGSPAGYPLLSGQPPDRPLSPLADRAGHIVGLSDGQSVTTTGRAQLICVEPGCGRQVVWHPPRRRRRSR